MSSGIHIVPIEEDRVKHAIKNNYSLIAFGTDFNFIKVGLKSIEKLK